MGEDHVSHEFLNPIDVLIMGRKRFEMVFATGQWPYGGKLVVVISSKPVQIPSHLVETVESQSCYPTELVKQLSERGVGHIYVDWGKTIQGFLNAAMIQ